MNAPTTRRLKQAGVNIDFLGWLEGAEQRLPSHHGIRKVSDEHFARAIRAAVWLRQHSRNAPQPDDWRNRYAILKAFVSAGLEQTMPFHRTEIDKDLDSLLFVVGTLLSPGARSQYEDDIKQLRKQSAIQKTYQTHGMSAKPSGGKAESEETQRIRAALEYLVQSGKGNPYNNLSDFWNEWVGSGCYDPDRIRNRIRKGVPRDEQERGEIPGGFYALEFWRAIYQGNWHVAYPVKFPYSSAVPVPESRESLFSWPPVDP